MSGIIRNVVAITLVGLLAGCVSPPPDSPFAAVQSSVSQRVGHQVQWNRMSRDDRAVSDAVQSMLAKPLSVDGRCRLPF